MAQLSMFMVSKIFPSRKRKIVVDGIVPRGWGGPGWAHVVRTSRSSERPVAGHCTNERSEARAPLVFVDDSGSLAGMEGLRH